MLGWWEAAGRSPIAVTGAPSVRATVFLAGNGGRVAVALANWDPEQVGRLLVILIIRRILPFTLLILIVLRIKGSG